MVGHTPDHPHRRLMMRTTPLQRSATAVAALTAAATLLVLGTPLAAGAENRATAPVWVSSTADPSITWSLEPASETGADQRISLRHTLDAGASVDDHLALTNYSDRPVSFDVYASDGTITEDGNFDLIPADQPSTGGGAWITISDVAGTTPRAGGGITIEVPAASTAIIPVEITVPASATPGDHPAGIVAELRPAADSPVQFASRVGVRAHVRVSGAIDARLSPSDVEASYTPSWNPFAPGTLSVRYSITNDGNVRLASDTITRVSGPFGILSTDVAANEYETLPAESTNGEATLEVWPLFFTWGEVAVTPQAVGDDVVGTALDPAAADFTVWTVPWSQLVMLLLIASVIALAVWLRKRSRARVQARIDAAVAAATTGAGADEEA